MIITGCASNNTGCDREGGVCAQNMRVASIFSIFAENVVMLYREKMFLFCCVQLRQIIGGNVCIGRNDK